ncbi:signal peptidase I [Gilvimarinus sp. 1_MG-2023]|uniref:signal peptidase I n=1 Tax=Gilvimarinus sp. 1_MG-2023 TaxID=3062638 RepID=UPI0026E17EF6|nr:signal peptidase I [Gilvimarinus sp. 1_MG-2023]MDO6747144.1 signal peptidase I [Gilvimarinus sp. 1_MG-2023]
MENINLPLILTIGVFFTGLAWLFDRLILSAPRRRKVAAVKAEFEGRNITDENSQDYELYHRAMAAAEREPVVIEFSKSFFPVLLVVFVLRSFIAEPFQIPSGSMEPTLDVGDFILVNKFTYGIRLPVINKKIIEINDPERGDVMVFFPPHLPDTYYIKRVIGLPGDLVRYENHKLFINGEAVPETLQAVLPAQKPQFKLVRETLGEHEFTSRKYLRPGQYSRRGSWRVPEGHYFMVGDNRDNSFDSRGWDDPFVPEDHIVGKAMVVWMHWDSLFSLPSFDRAGAID